MSAIISDCGMHRYRLDREVQEHGVVIAYFGINPSTADASIDDATVRKWRGFTLRNGGRKFIVGNAFSLRSTDVRGLNGYSHYPIGKDQRRYIAEIIGDADMLVPCWGNTTKVNKELRHVISDLLKQLIASGKPVMHFGLTKSGDPIHPLMLGYSTSIKPLEYLP